MPYWARFTSGLSGLFLLRSSRTCPAMHRSQSYPLTPPGIRKAFEIEGLCSPGAPRTQQTAFCQNPYMSWTVLGLPWKPPKTHAYVSFDYRCACGSKRRSKCHVKYTIRSTTLFKNTVMGSVLLKRACPIFLETNVRFP